MMQDVVLDGFAIKNYFPTSNPFHEINILKYYKEGKWVTWLEGTLILQQMRCCCSTSHQSMINFDPFSNISQSTCSKVLFFVMFLWWINFWWTGTIQLLLIVCQGCFISAVPYIDGLVQDCSISSALALEILQSCTKPSISYMIIGKMEQYQTTTNQNKL